MMDIIRLLHSDNTWASLEKDWEQQCSKVDEDFRQFATAARSSIARASIEPMKDEWAIGLKRDDTHLAIAYARATRQKGFDGKVLRIREVCVCPLLDYGELEENEYIATLIGILNGAVNLSETKLVAKHIKIHLRSPADASFFRSFGQTLDSKQVFANVETHGAWLTITKKSGSKFRVAK